MAWVSPRVWTALEKLSAAKLNEISSSLNAIGDPWTAYGTPSTLWTAVTTNPTIGNGTCTGRYMQAGKWVQGSLSISIGSTTTVGSGIYIFLLPPVTPLNFRTITGKADLFDTSAGSIIPRVILGTNNTTFAVADLVPNRISNSSPVTWATGDRIDIGFTYEAA